MAAEKRILLVDDNPQYRSAVTRNLSLAGYKVIQSEDSRDGMEKVQTEDPHVVITDLDMRTHDEGLDFIRELKKHVPKLPVIMISAVGSFDEGALARQYGAAFVLSKSRIDEEINTLYKKLDQLFEHREQVKNLAERLELALQDGGESLENLRGELNRFLQKQDLDDSMKSEVYEYLDSLERALATSDNLLEESEPDDVSQSIKSELPEVDALDEETRTMLGVAESLQRSNKEGNLSIARNISFSYSFAVEHEVKLRIGRKVNRLLSSDTIKTLVEKMYDKNLNNLDMFFNQYLIRYIQQQDLELNSEITRQVLERILKHGAKYKPDGLKALGVILFCWGRNYEFKNRKGKVNLNNPLGIKGINDDQVTHLASQLIRLQHLRNPFIHPEFNEWEKTESVRQVSFSCLSIISNVV